MEDRRDNSTPAYGRETKRDTVYWLMEEGQQYTDLWKRDNSTLTYGRGTTVHWLMEERQQYTTYGRETTTHWLMEERQKYIDSWKRDNSTLTHGKATTLTYGRQEGQQYTDLWKVRQTQTNAESKLRRFTPQPGSGWLTSPPFIDPSPVVFTVPAPDEGALGVSDGMGLMPGWCGVCWVPESATSSPPACTDWNHHTISSLSVVILHSAKNNGH